ncbi:hypothetical protein TGAM01_v202293 [Trichoderma gamsii]|uniref:Uncharacterized protein n=1 Tax=Trichoderma gamsii TaxID=398673 RepID=A0A2P4ZY03_9HYPO|nr:hypothetical protein TGAM01_v202293 [Trichoderma gamsii]PON29185.1 hypothetical protein TGAM01_v202293 [Trichoderma gamsii]
MEAHRNSPGERTDLHRTASMPRRTQGQDPWSLFRPISGPTLQAFSHVSPYQRVWTPGWTPAPNVLAATAALNEARTAHRPLDRCMPRPEGHSCGSAANALVDGTTTTSTPLARCATPGAATTAATPWHRCLSDLASELPMPQLRMINNLQTADNCATICTFFRNLNFLEGRDFFFY